MFMEMLPAKATVRGAQIEYVRTGSGPVLLYLHGCDGIDASDPFIAPLAEKFDVVALSMPGFGASEMPRFVKTTADIAELVIEFTEVLGLKDYILVGSSFGGWVAAEMAAARIAAISRLILVDALGVRFTKDPAECEIFDIFIVPTADNPYPYFSDAKKAEAAFGRMEFAAMPEGAALRYCRNREALTTVGWAPLLYDPTLRWRLDRIAVPTLVLWGADDKIVSVDYGRQYAEAIPNAAFKTILDAGHYLPIEAPNAFAREVGAFALELVEA